MLTRLRGSSPNASWHTDYRDTAFVYFGGLPFELSEGDVITIFSQYGEPVFLKLARDKETGKSKGFGWLKYEDQRSTDLAVDNLGGASIGGRLISVDHARYKSRDDEDDDEFKIGWEGIQKREGGAGAGSDTEMGDATPSEDEDKDRKHKSSRRRIRDHEELPEERELQRLIDEHDDEDPMKGFLIEEKKKEVDDARRLRDEKGTGGDRHRHHHRSSRSHRSHRSRRDGDADRGKKGVEKEKERERSSRRDRSDRGRDGEHDKHRDHARDKERDSHSRRDQGGEHRRHGHGKDDDRDRERERDHGHDKDRHRERDYRESSSRRRDRDRSEGRDRKH